MARRKYNPGKYKRSKPGDPLTDEWTVRSAVMYGEKREILIRKVNGKKQRRMIVDKRMSPTVSWGEARAFHNQRTSRAKAMDKSLQHKKQKKQPDRAWKRRPGRSDIVGIDNRKKRKKNK